MIGNIGNLTAPSGAGGITDMQPRVLSGEQRLRDIESKIKEQETNLAKAEADIKQAEREEEINVIGAKAQAKQKEADDIRTRQTENKRKMAEFGDPEFHPTEENAVSLAQLFSLVATSGLLLGSSGKMSAMNSLAAMNGAMEGWQAGRADLYKKEVDKFNKETERRRRIREDLRQDLEDYMKLSAMDREAASMKQEEIIRKAGTSSIIGAYTAKGNAQAALNALKADERIEKDILDRQQKARDTQARLQSWKNVGVDAAGNIVQVNAEGQQRTLAGVSPARGAKGGARGAAGGGATKTSATQQQFENITSADIGNAYFRINEWLGSAKDPEKIPTGSKFLRDRGKQTGIIDAFKNYAVNKTLPADLQANDAALLGIAFDIVAARAFGRATGVTDAKIAEVVRQLPIEGDTEETKRLKLRILFNQLEEPNRLLPKEKKVEGSTYMLSPKAKGFYEKYSKASTGEAPAQAAGVKSYATEAEAANARKRGELKAGEKVNIGGVSGTWED